MTDRELMQQALEALESDPVSHAGLVNRKQAITALRQALETEPFQFWSVADGWVFMPTTYRKNEPVVNIVTGLRLKEPS